MQNFSESWKKIEAYLNAGISLIPVREKADEYAPAKTPYRGWKKYQSELPSSADLWKALEDCGTQSTAFICGSVSGNLEAIDIDSKYYPGIDATFFQDIKSIYPDLYEKLRIHRTPSGGYHIIYRITDHSVPGNQKLASRQPTAEELEVNPKSRSKCFIETRGEGGYILSDSSEGYTVVKDNPIPQITWEERCSIIDLAKSFNEVVPESTNKMSVPIRQSDYYDENPFEHFNKSPEAEQILVDAGWSECARNNHFIWFTRPGKDRGVSASFNLSKRIYWIFSTSTELEADKGYFPSKLLSILNHGDNGKKTYQELVQRGFGRISQQAEANIIKKSITASNPPPANLSPAAINTLQLAKSEIDTKYPHGIFWQINDKFKYEISRDNLYQVAEKLGYIIDNDNNLYQIEGKIVHKRTERQFYDSLKAYIAEEDYTDYTNLCNAYEAFIQRSGQFTITRLPIIDEDKLMKDSKLECFKFYLNGYLRITPSDCTLLPYETMPKMVYAHRIQQRDYFEHPNPSDTIYLKFLDKAINLNQKIDYVSSIIGYLCHEYKDDTTGYIIVMTEQCQDPKDGGGTGKNLFASLLNLSTTCQSMPGEQMKFDEKFMQTWNGQRVFAVHDLPKHFNFMFLKEMSTGSGVMKKLYKDEVIIPSEKMPKFLLSTNYSYDVADGGLKRRIIPLEFTDFFTKSGGVDVHFGAHFPTGWTDDDYSGYDTFVAASIQLWLSSGLKMKANELSGTGWIKQFEYEYGVLLHQFISTSMPKWIGKNVKVDEFNLQYEKFCNEENIPKNYRASSIKMNNALKAYCKNINIEFSPSDVIKENNVTFRVKYFGPENVPF